MQFCRIEDQNMLFDLPVCANDAETGAAYDSACAESVGLNRRRCSCEQRPLFFFSVHEFNEVFFRRQSPSMRRIYALTAYIIYSGDDETEFSKKLNFPETADSSEIAQPPTHSIVPLAIQGSHRRARPLWQKCYRGLRRLCALASALPGQSS